MSEGRSGRGSGLACTVVVCGYSERRYADLVAAVDESIRQLAQAPAASHEVLVVIDHNDSLRERLVGAAAGRCAAGGGIPVRVLDNTRRQGLSGARNTALERASGEIVVFLDDDALPRPGWLARLLAPYADQRVVAVGGAAHPRWPESGRPGQLPAAPGRAGEFDWVVGCTYDGQPRSRSEVRNLMGCNMSFRRAAFARVGGFDEDLGRVGAIPLGCEETELCLRVRRDDARAAIVFEPAAGVDHWVSPDRVRWRYFWSRCRAEGISKAAVVSRSSADVALATERTYITQVLPRGARRLVAQAARSPRRSAAGLLALSGGLVMTGIGYLQGRWALRDAEPAPTPQLTLR